MKRIVEAVGTRLYPSPKKAETGCFLINFEQDGCFLQQVLGRILWEFNTIFRPREVNQATHHVLPLCDVRGAVKLGL